MTIVWAALCAVASAALIAALLRTGWAWRIATDHPNARSLHTRMTPRAGGLGLMAGVLIAALATVDETVIGICVCALGLSGVSLLDDRYGLPIAWRFGAHWLAAIVMVVMIWGLHAGALALCLSAVACVWMTNLYNFMDGADGLAGGMALIGFASLACLQAGSPMALPAACVAGAAAGFLIFNWHPARIFMGDCGSVPTGFMAAALGMAGIAQGDWPWWFPLWVFSPFIGDATITLLRRGLRGEKIWLAHREHYYQRAIRLGAGHARVAALAYGLMLTACVTGSWAVRVGDILMTWALAGGMAVLYIVVAVAVDWRWRRHLMQETAHA
jgi:UDP-N-acetylmuramyl pentapeptide phosphotransferase/UDP-N-acetylglucosamine-1-phosphate transferase